MEHPAHHGGPGAAPFYPHPTTASQALLLSILTAPVVAGGVSTSTGPKDLVFSISIEDTLTALDAGSGQIVWQKKFPNPLTPLRPVSINCSNTEQATPTIDKAKGIIYFNTSD